MTPAHAHGLAGLNLQDALVYGLLEFGLWGIAVVVLVWIVWRHDRYIR